VRATKLDLAVMSGQVRTEGDSTFMYHWDTFVYGNGSSERVFCLTWIVE
jgi:hypothetical protein